MNDTTASLGWLVCVALLAAAALLGAARAGAAEPAAPQSAPADLRELAGQPVPDSPAIRWKYAEIEIEWGFKDGAEKLAFDGTIESSHARGMVGTAKPLPGDTLTVMTGDRAWRSPPGASRRGIVAGVLYTPVLRGPGRTILTVRTASGSFSFQPVDLRHGPILVGELGFFIRDLSPKHVEPPAPKTSEVLPPGDLLNAKLAAAAGTPSVKGWGSKDTPSVYSNPGAEAVSFLNGAIRVPPRSVAVHPGPDRDVAVAWRSPVAGKVSVRAKVADGHPSGGDGVTWAIVHDGPAGSKVVVQGAIDRGGSQSIPAAADSGPLAGLAVHKGDNLLLVIGRRGDHLCDTTIIELVITEASGPESPGRTWDLAKDVAADIQAGNPHADSFGNAGVWYFLAPGGAGGQQEMGAAPVVFESKAATARQYVQEIAARKLKTIRQQVREQPEQTWEGAMRAMHGDAPFPPFPRPPYEPRMSVDVPDGNLAALWRIGAWQIIKNCPRIHRDDITKVGRFGDVTRECRRIADPKDPSGVYVVRDNPFPPLGCETDRILWALDQMGMHEVARDGMSVWLDNQQKDGALSLNSGMETAHKVGALQLPWVMAEHYRLTGDKAWLKKELPRLKAAADWITKRRRATMKEKLSQAELDGIKAGTWSPYGLQPRIQMGDGDPTGASYFYAVDAFAYRSVKLLADVVGEVDPGLAADLSAEAARYRKDILRVVEESLALSPVIRTRDGMYHPFLPQGFQDRGPRARALPQAVNIFSHCGPYSSDIVATSASIEAWLQSGLLSIDDPRIDGHFDVLEDVFLLDNPWVRKRTRGYDPEGTRGPAPQWFGNGGFGYQSGWERLPDYYLAKDDIPNFLRSWLNRCAVDMNLGNWTFNEHTTFAPNDKSHGNSVFLSNFRKMLVLEAGETLWLARGTPRAWLRQGQRIAVKNAPTHFGEVDYEIASDVENGKITATVRMPSRRAPAAVLLRFRHPAAAPMKSATVNGKEWKDFDPVKEVVRLVGLVREEGLGDTVKVQVSY